MNYVQQHHVPSFIPTQQFSNNSVPMSIEEITQTPRSQPSRLQAQTQQPQQQQQHVSSSVLPLVQQQQQALSFDNHLYTVSQQPQQSQQEQPTTNTSYQSSLNLPIVTPFGQVGNAYNGEMLQQQYQNDDHSIQDFNELLDNVFDNQEIISEGQQDIILQDSNFNMLQASDSLDLSFLQQYGSNGINTL
eukprot:TRINITY_DN7193_c0_g1_i1.p2 TRINITY_DN7193_c0_g1~~TRINITY_DN7193_c0_g1_i1.p2  ORF type:complete len:197 (-),score=26.65 TRINITY_DN7193_c0_g1_i1:369-935(-)